MRELLISLSEERLSFEILINDILLWFFSKKKKRQKINYVTTPLL